MNGNMFFSKICPFFCSVITTVHFSLHSQGTMDNISSSCVDIIAYIKFPSWRHPKKHEFSVAEFSKHNELCISQDIWIQTQLTIQTIPSMLLDTDTSIGGNGGVRGRGFSLMMMMIYIIIYIYCMLIDNDIFYNNKLSNNAPLQSLCVQEKFTPKTFNKRNKNVYLYGIQ